MDRRIKVTIITVCYNSEQTIRRCIESVLHQTYENIEYIIVDGASTDGTMKIVKEYEPLFQGRLRWVSEPDDGIYYAMNKGIDMATGELIGLLNSDDTYELTAAEDMVDRADVNKYQVLYGFVRTIRNGRMEGISLVSQDVLPDRMFNHSPCFVTSKVYRDFFKFDTQYRSIADYDFMLKLYNTGKVDFIPVYTLISNFYRGGMSETDVAYLDLLKMQKNYGKISKMKYRYKQFTSKILKLKRKVFS